MFKIGRYNISKLLYSLTNIPRLPPLHSILLPQRKQRYNNTVKNNHRTKRNIKRNISPIIAQHITQRKSCKPSKMGHARGLKNRFMAARTKPAGKASGKMRTMNNSQPMTNTSISCVQNEAPKREDVVISRVLTVGSDPEVIVTASTSFRISSMRPGWEWSRRRA